jgi:DHA3 family macrolide efflux protein-like MFS transporter
MMAYQPPPHGFRTFVIVWVTQSISVFGSALTFFSINIYLTQTLYPLPEQKPQLAFALSAISLAFALPVVFGAPLAGAWADRHDRKRTMMAMDFLSGCLSLVLMSLMAAEGLQVWVLIALIVLFAIVSAFHSAAFDTSYAMIVPEEQLPRANGMMQTMWSLSGILSPMIAATIIALPALARQGQLPGLIGTPLARLADGVPLAIAVDALTFFLASATLVFLFIPSPRQTDLDLAGGGKKPNLWADVKVGAVFIWRRRPLLWLLGTFAVANFMAGPLGVFQPLIVKFNLAADWGSRGFTFETALALLSTAGAIGGVAGGFLVSAWGGLKSRRVYGVVLALVVAGLAQVAFGLSSLLFLTAAMALLDSAMIPIMNSHSQTIWQMQTPRELQGRVFAVRRLIAQFTWPLSTALAGWAGGAFNPGAVIAVLGGFLALFCLAQLFNPSLLRVEDRDYLEAYAVSVASD